jgi:hypothetical protein
VPDATGHDRNAGKALKLFFSSLAKTPISVMAGLVPAIHAFFAELSKNVDVRDKRGHDDFA